MEQNLINFLTVLESLIPKDSPLLEASEAGKLLGKTPGQPSAEKPGTREIIRLLHTQYGLSHNQTFEPIQAILFQELKDHYQGSWALIIGDSGTGAIKWNGSTYLVAAANKNGTYEWANDRGGALKDWMKSHIGSLRKFYVTPSNNYATRKRGERSLAKAANSAPGEQVTLDSLIMRLKPLWHRYLTLAQADVAGMVKSMVTSGAYSRANQKIAYLSRIASVLEKMEEGDYTTNTGGYASDDSVVGFLGNALKGALAMTAHQFYPELTGRITRDTNGRYRVNEEGIKKILMDINNGDMSKISTTMRHFKRTLL